MASQSFRRASALNSRFRTRSAIRMLAAACSRGRIASACTTSDARGSWKTIVATGDITTRIAESESARISPMVQAAS